jgi:lysophospholipase L1-like esterase
MWLSLMVLIAGVGATLRAAGGPTTQPASLRVLPAGDSLTAAPYYRRELLQLAGAHALSIKLVGPLGNDDLGGHAGFSGATASQIRESLAAALQQSRPDLVLLMMGTNNMNHGLGLRGEQARGYPTDERGVALAAMFAPPVEGSFLNGLGATWGDPSYGTTYLAGEIDATLRLVLDQNASIRVIVSTIPPIARGSPEWVANNDNARLRVVEYNDLIRAAVRRFETSHPGRIKLADPSDAFCIDYEEDNSLSDFGTRQLQSEDWVHPRPEARAWSTVAARFFDQIVALRDESH